MAKQAFYFTFGSAHLFCDHYLIIFAVDHSAARDYMFYKFGPNWGFCYDVTDWTREYIMSGLSGNMREIGVFHADKVSTGDLP